MGRRHHHLAFGAVQRRVQPAALAASMDAKRHEYAMLVVSGRWFTPERQEIDAAMAALQADVTGLEEPSVFSVLKE